MGKDSFTFRHFIVRHDRCAMKVGTDGTLLGTWAGMAEGEGRVLDVGTGTGLIALMMAQRYPLATVTAIDIDPEAVSQARDNIAASPFSQRISVMTADFARFPDAEPFDAIVSNPPYFDRSLECPDSQRTTARHTATLSYRQLIRSAWPLLTDEGRFSLIIPADCLARLEAEARLQGFFLTRRYAVHTTPSKPPKRYLIELRKHPVEEIDKQDVTLESSPGQRSPWYHRLTQDFYIK
ncbi:MAG: methyltransferase [Prevotella sp.]|nr:methyltransferase [Prevotella sp.]